MAHAVAGVDWASEHNDLRISGPDGRPICERRLADDEAGVTQLVALCVEHEVEAVAIERPEGLLVDRLLEAGLCVVPIHPNQVKAARERFAIAGKSDRFDAYVLAELARTDRHRFRALAPDSDDTRALRALTRSREDLVAHRTALTQQLRAELERSWPGAIGLFAELDSPISLAFLVRYPSPHDARALGERRLQAFLAKTPTAAARGRRSSWSGCTARPSRGWGRSRPRLVAESWSGWWRRCARW
jgi:transposase